MAHIEFVNLSRQVLWVPERTQLSFRFDGDSDSIEVMPPSACSGLTFKHVGPGKKLSYDKGVQIPYMKAGPIEISVREEENFKLPFTIE